MTELEIITCLLHVESSIDRFKDDDDNIDKGMIDHWNKYFRKYVENISNHPSRKNCCYNWDKGYGCSICDIIDEEYPQAKKTIDDFMKWKGNSNKNNLTEIIAAMFSTPRIWNDDDYWDNDEETIIATVRFQKWDQLSDSDKQKYLKRAENFIKYYIYLW